MQSGGGDFFDRTIHALLKPKDRKGALRAPPFSILRARSKYSTPPAEAAEPGGEAAQMPGNRVARRTDKALPKVKHQNAAAIL